MLCSITRINLRVYRRGREGRGRWCSCVVYSLHKWQKGQFLQVTANYWKTPEHVQRHSTGGHRLLPQQPGRRGVRKQKGEELDRRSAPSTRQWGGESVSPQWSQGKVLTLIPADKVGGCGPVLRALEVTQGAWWTDRVRCDWKSHSPGTGQ